MISRTHGPYVPTFWYFDTLSYCFRGDWCLFCDADVAEEDVGFVHGGELNDDGVAGGYGGGVEAHGAFRPFAGNEAHGGAVGHVFLVGVSGHDHEVVGAVDFRCGLHLKFDGDGVGVEKFGRLQEAVANLEANEYGATGLLDRKSTRLNSSHRG